MKRITCFLLVITLLFSLHLSSYATSFSSSQNLDEFMNVVNERFLQNSNLVPQNVFTVVDFSGHSFVVVQCSPKGYFIFEPDTQLCIEYNLNAECPLYNSDTTRYGGPTQYYTWDNNGYSHTVLCSRLSEEAAELLGEQNRLWHDELMNANSRLEPMRGTDYWITNRMFFTGTLEDNCGYISGGYCGYIAANMILKYWHYRGNITLPNGFGIPSSTGLTAALINRGAALGYSNSTNPLSIATIINSYCSLHNFPQCAYNDLYTTGVVYEINCGRPVILACGNYSETIGHAIVAYGYNTYENSGNTTYRCHYGWPSTASNSYSDVHICWGVDFDYIEGNTQYRIS